MMFLKALSYSLNNPCKEMLYNPTSTDVKFKAKSWIDIFGQRGASDTGCIHMCVWRGGGLCASLPPMSSISIKDPPFYTPHHTTPHTPNPPKYPTPKDAPQTHQP